MISNDTITITLNLLDNRRWVSHLLRNQNLIERGTPIGAPCILFWMRLQQSLLAAYYEQMNLELCLKTNS